MATSSRSRWTRVVSLFLAVLVGLGLRPADAQVIRYHHVDAVGSVRALTNQAGVVIERHDYLPFGEECLTGPCAENLAGSQPLRFAGKERDRETGLDYFGARYYGSKIARFTSVDPILDRLASVLAPQRWNRYSYALNNPFRYLDPDGREVTYANDDLQTFFVFLASRSPTARATLDLYTGPGKPDLFVTHAEAGQDIDGTDASGTFHTNSKNYEVSYAGKEGQIQPGMTANQIEDLGTWSLVGQATLTLDAGLTISVQNKSTVRTALHELGHADQAARSPLQYKRDAAVERHPNGIIIEHDSRPSEVVANQYRDRAVQEVRP